MNDKKEKNNIKKYVKVLILVVLIVLAIIIIFVGRNMYIISKLSKNAEETIKTDNYYEKIYVYNLETYETIETFKLGDKIKTVQIDVNGKNIYKTTTIGKKVEGSENQYLVNIYREESNEKVAVLNQERTMPSTLINSFETKNFWDLLQTYSFATIRNEEYRGEKSYHISNSLDNVYANKNTGLVVSTLGQDVKNAKDIPEYESKRFSTSEHIYKFNTTTENDFNEPNMDEYKIKDET